MVIVVYWLLVILQKIMYKELNTRSLIPMNQPVVFLFHSSVLQSQKKTRFVSLQGEEKTLSSWNMF